MPRKTSQRSAAIAEAKNEGSAPRRSGRAATKQETTTTTTKEASRSRRSSTAAQTAASVADSRTPRGKGSSRRESTSPSDSRSRTGGETPATRVKSTRRSTGRINYKESDGEEEVSNTKFDENFESGEDLEESETDEKSKTRGRSRSTKAAAKGTEKSKGSSRSRRGRPSKKKEDEEEEEEENETFDVSDDSNEPQEVPVKRGRAAKEKEPAKPVRNRRQKAEVTEVKKEEKSRQTRRSGRGSTNKEESPKKRPTRGVQAKRYAEDDDDEIEEISDSRADDDEVEEIKETEGRKRKRGASPEEANKRLKDAGDEHDEEQSKELTEKEEKDITEEAKESTEEKKSVEEPMEIDTSDSAPVPETEKKAEEVKEEKNTDLKVEEKVDETDKEHVEEKMEQECTEEKMEQEETVSAPKEKQSIADKQDSIGSSSKDENIQSSDADKKIEPSSAELVAVNEADKSKPTDTPVEEIKIEEPKVEKVPEPISQPAEQKPERENLTSVQPPVASEPNPEKNAESKSEPPLDATVKANNETPKTEKVPQEEKNVPSVEETTVPAVTPVPETPPKESISDTTLNGADQTSTTQNSTNEVLNVSTPTPNVNFDHAENNTPKANGAHNDVQHTNSPLKDQYYLLPGRKYVINSKLNENLRQSVKNSMFGFVSFNLGTPDSDAYLQKDKLLNELSKLDAHVICLQQVAKPFYNAVLEPSLDALGFKSVFSQPQDSLKGMATFYKSSLFRLSGKSDISLRELVEKEIEASPLDSEQKAAVKSHIRRCGSVLFTHFSTVIGTQTITVANVQIPRSDFSSHALQISCLAQEVIRINGGTNKPLLLGGEFNIAENDASYQLLRDGYLSNEMIEELQQRKDVVLPDNKHDSLVNLLWKSFQHPSSNLCSCYHSVLDHEFIIPELKTASPDLLWYSSDSLHTVGVLDVVSDKTGDHHLSLKADIAFSI